MKIKLHFRRFEFKYLLLPDVYKVIKAEIKNYVRKDPYLEEKKDEAYHVVSLYYDSPQYHCYHDKIDGIPLRSKFRLRTYFAQDVQRLQEPRYVYMEIKRKIDMTIIKDRIQVDYKKWLENVDGNIGLIDRRKDIVVLSENGDSLLEEFFYYKSRHRFRPSVLISYLREPYIGRYHSHVRITFDSQIKACRSDYIVPNGRWFSSIFPGMVVMELKFNGAVPYWFHRIIQEQNLSREPMSKYSYSCDKVIFKNEFF